MLVFLRLVRLPNVLTAMADAMAGYFLVRGPAVKPHELLLLMIASGCIYGGGCALNDVRDFELDRVERPSRPLPSGAVSRRAALWFSVFLLGFGLGAAALVGIGVLGMAVLLVSLVICYDCLTKNIPMLGSLTMAACRGGNLMLGMMPVVPVGVILALPLVSMTYVFGLTTLSKHETSITPRFFKAVAMSWIVAALASIVGFVAMGLMTPHALVALVALLLLIGLPLGRWWQDAVPRNTARAVKALVLGIPLLDAVYVSGTQDWLLALPLVGLVVLAVTAAKWMHVS